MARFRDQVMGKPFSGRLHACCICSVEHLPRHAACRLLDSPDAWDLKRDAATSSNNSFRRNAWQTQSVQLIEFKAYILPPRLGSCTMKLRDLNRPSSRANYYILISRHLVPPCRLQPFEKEIGLHLKFAPDVNVRGEP